MPIQVYKLKARKIAQRQNVYKEIFPLSSKRFLQEKKENP